MRCGSRDVRGGRTMKRILALALASGALIVAAGSTALPAKADGPTPAQLTAAGWTCIQPRLLPPLPGTPGFADRLPSYEFLVFSFATGSFLGTEHLLRPDIFEHGTPPCLQQPGGQYIYNPRNDLWFCNRLGIDPSS
jgi:hypothetical protein